MSDQETNFWLGLRDAMTGRELDYPGYDRQPMVAEGRSVLYNGVPCLRWPTSLTFRGQRWGDGQRWMNGYMVWTDENMGTLLLVQPLEITALPFGSTFDACEPVYVPLVKPDPYR